MTHDNSQTARNMGIKKTKSEIKVSLDRIRQALRPTDREQIEGHLRSVLGLAKSLAESAKVDVSEYERMKAECTALGRRYDALKESMKAASEHLKARETDLNAKSEECKRLHDRVGHISECLTDCIAHYLIDAIEAADFAINTLGSCDPLWAVRIETDEPHYVAVANIVLLLLTDAQVAEKMMRVIQETLD